MLARSTRSVFGTGVAPRVVPAVVVAPARRSLQVVAAEPQNKKRTPQPVSRAPRGRSWGKEPPNAAAAAGNGASLVRSGVLG